MPTPSTSFSSTSLSSALICHLTQKLQAAFIKFSSIPFHHIHQRSTFLNFDRFFRCQPHLSTTQCQHHLSTTQDFLRGELELVYVFRRISEHYPCWFFATLLSLHGHLSNNVCSSTSAMTTIASWNHLATSTRRPVTQAVVGMFPNKQETRTSMRKGCPGAACGLLLFFLLSSRMQSSWSQNGASPHWWTNGSRKAAACQIDRSMESGQDESCPKLGASLQSQKH